MNNKHGLPDVAVALTGLEIFLGRLTQGVALGYYLSGLQPFRLRSNFGETS
jgi:hypothetical protein